MRSKIKIAIADDHTIFREGFISHLNNFGFDNIVFEATNAKEVFEGLKTNAADILFLDIHMPDTKGTETLEKVKKQYPNVKVIILSGYYFDGLIIEFVKKGCNAFLSKDCNSDVLVKTVETVYEKGICYDEKILSLLPEINAKSPNGNIDGLSESELNIIVLLCSDLSHKQIADKMHISKHTVAHHCENISKKTNCHSPLQLFKYARSRGIIPLEF